MKQENISKIKQVLKRVNAPFKPKYVYDMYKEDLKMSYKTFLRGIILFLKTRDIYGYKISHGRGRGINWIITNNELLERKEKS